MVKNKLFSKLRKFWSKLCKSNWTWAWNLAFPVFISPIVWNMYENLHYESVHIKELHNEQEYYWPTIYGAGAVVVSTITRFSSCGEISWKGVLRWIKEWVLVTCEVLWLDLVFSSIFLRFNLRPLCLRPEPLWT